MYQTDGDDKHSNGDVRSDNSMVNNNPFHGGFSGLQNNNMNSLNHREPLRLCKYGSKCESRNSGGTFNHDPINKMCKNIQQNKSCSRGDACLFKHSDNTVSLTANLDLFHENLEWVRAKNELSR